MESKEIICEYTTTLDYFKKGCHIVNVVEGLIGLYSIAVFGVLILNVFSSNYKSIIIANIGFIILILVNYCLPIIKYKSSVKKYSSKRIVIFGENEIKTNCNIAFLTKDIKRIYENKDFYYIVTNKRIRLLVPKSGLNVTKEDFESFVLKYFAGLKKKKIFQIKKVLIKKIILTIIACLLYFGILIELGSY